MSEKYIVTWDMLQIHARKLASRLMPSEQWKGIIAVSRGGLVPGALLARELGIRHVDTVCISSYDHDNQRELKVLKRAEGDGEGFIVIDDLVDTGGTAVAIREMYPKAHFVTIFAKPAGRPLVDDYVVDNLTESDIMLVEANHDINMLQVGPYPFYLKKRILGNKGHLSNETSGQLVNSLLHDKLKKIYLGHLSKENNYDKLAYETVKLEIDMSDNSFKSSDFDIEVAKRDVLSGICEI